MFLAGSIVPLDLMPAAVERVTHFLPFRYLYFFQVQLLQGRLEFTAALAGLAIQAGVAAGELSVRAVGVCRRGAPLRRVRRVGYATLRADFTWPFAKNSFLNALEYRLSFTVWSIATICYTAVYVASVQIIFNHVQTIGGWRVEQMLVLAATVMIVDGIVESIFGENMNALSGLINRGELDFVLSKPVNTRFYVSTRKFDWDPLVQVVLGGGVLWYAISLLAEPVTWFGALLYLGMVACACLIAYSLWFIVISVTFFVGRLNNVGHLYYNLIEASRVPTDVSSAARSAWV